MAVYRRREKNISGKVRALSKYSVEFTDHADVRRRVQGFSDKAASLELERNLKRLVALRAAGAAPDTEAVKFLETCPADLKTKLARWGIIEEHCASASLPIADHIADWYESMIAQGCTVKHAKESASDIREIAAWCGWNVISDIQPIRFVHWINTRKAAGLSAQRINHKITRTKTFCNWLIRNGRMTHSPVAHVAKLNVQADRRRIRRALTVEEAGALIAAAENDPGTHHGLDGQARALLYRMAIETGLRYNELRTLTRADLHLGGEQPTVTIQAKNAKNRKSDTLPLRPRLADMLKIHCAQKAPAARVFDGLWVSKGYEIIHQDAAAAGIECENESGIIDFHSLRHTTGTWLARAGVPLATAQQLMRHSDPKLTANVYTHVVVADKARELAKMPEIISQHTEAMMTGTNEIKNTGGLTGGKGYKNEKDIQKNRDTPKNILQNTNGRKKHEKSGVFRNKIMAGGGQGAALPAVCYTMSDDLLDRAYQNIHSYKSKINNELQEKYSGAHSTGGKTGGASYFTYQNRLEICNKNTCNKIPSELVTVVDKWSDIPVAIQEAVLAVLRPYIDTN